MLLSRDSGTVNIERPDTDKFEIYSLTVFICKCNQIREWVNSREIKDNVSPFNHITSTEWIQLKYFKQQAFQLCEKNYCIVTLECNQTIQWLRSIMKACTFYNQNAVKHCAKELCEQLSTR